MRKLIVIVVVVAALWSGYWLIGSRGVENSVRDWLDARGDQGWQAEYSQVATRGFPNRFDTTISDIALADPATGVAWSAPFFQILRLSYKRDHQILIWPDTQTIASPYQRIDLGSERARASVVFVPDTALQLDRANVVFDGIELRSSLGWAARIASGLLAARAAGADNSYDLGFEAKEIVPSDDLLAGLDPLGLFPKVIERLKIDATVGFDAPWDQSAIEIARPAITEIQLNLMQAEWGELELWAAGDLSVDADGRLDGQITVKAKNWREMLQIGQAAGWIPDTLVPTLESGLELLAALSGPRNSIDAPLTFRNGSVSFGPIPLGNAPRLWLR